MLEEQHRSKKSGEGLAEDKMYTTVGVIDGAKDEGGDDGDDKLRGDNG